MEQEVTYKVSANELRESFIEPIRREVRAEYLAKFNEQIVDVETVAKIHGVDPQTVRTYAQSGDLICEPRVEGGTFRFRLGNVLIVDFKELRKQLKFKRL